MTTLSSHKHHILAAMQAQRMLAESMARRAAHPAASGLPERPAWEAHISELRGFAALHGAVAEAVPFLVTEELETAKGMVPPADGAGVDWVTPYPVCLFEFVFKANNGISERAAILTHQLPSEPEIRMWLLFDMVEWEDKWLPGGWTLSNSKCVTFRADGTQEGGDERDRNMFKVVREICVLIDAGMTEQTEVLPPERLNKARAKKGKPPIGRHIVLGLRREHRASAGVGTAGKRRLHMVRGHWRTYEDHKTWIKWHLRGDATLGTAPAPIYEVRP